MQISRTATAIFLSIAATTLSSTHAASAPIVVLSGNFGRIGGKHRLDIVTPLQSLCAGTTNRCDVYCSETSFGRVALGRKPVCRVTWRCPDGDVRSTEAAKEEPILIRCSSSARREPLVDELPVQTYSPPAN